MSRLRQHLEHARDEYRRATYPGDLALDACELADRRRRGRVLRLFAMSTAGAAALAACILIAVLLMRPGRPTDLPHPEIASAIPQAPAMPAMPETMEMPETPSLGEAPALSNVPSMPSMPGWGLSWDTAGS